MGTGNKSVRKLESRAYKKIQGKTHEERVKKSFEFAKAETTTPTAKDIRKAYDAINEAIDNLDKNDILFPKKKHELQELKKDVPFKFAIPKKLQESIQSIINKVLAQKAPNNNTPFKRTNKENF